MNELEDQGLRCPRENPQYAYIAPNYGQAERVAWDLVKKYTKNIPGVEYNEAKLRCIIPRPHMNDKVTIFLLGAENPDSLRGMYLDGAILDEFAEMDPQVWGKVVRPALSDRKGWAIFIGTPKGQNHFYDILKTAKLNPEGQWFWKVLKASETNILPEAELRGMKAEMSDEAYEQELECSFTAALVGSYYGKIINEAQDAGRISKVPHDPALYVETFWDLGIADTTAIWFMQTYGQEVRFIDYLEMSGEGLDYYVKELKTGHRGKYNYLEHNLPHDGAARDLSTGKSREETLRSLGLRVRVHPKHAPNDGIQACRMLLRKCWIDEARCVRGLDALKAYEKKYDEKNKIFQDRPLHNWASHAADAFRLAAMAARTGAQRQSSKNLPRYSINTYDPFKY